MLVTELMKETKSPDVMMSWLPILECYFNKLDPKDYERLYDEIYETISKYETIWRTLDHGRSKPNTRW